jgi:NAD(P)H-hydrate epimerase
MSRAMVTSVLENVKCPLLIDADGLNIISENIELLHLLSIEQKKHTVITPHPGEMMRLCGKSVGEILDSVVKTAIEMSKKSGTVCLLKDHNTVITDGETVYLNHSGNSGMATAGMGDVLSGIIGALLARSKIDGDVLTSAAVGAYLHGLAGDKASELMGRYSLMASDVLSQIPHCIPR